MKKEINGDLTIRWVAVANGVRASRRRVRSIKVDPDRGVRGSRELPISELGNLQNDPMKM
jgi:hypothetical protein